jgi:hypothetical protein
MKIRKVVNFQKLKRLTLMRDSGFSNETAIFPMRSFSEKYRKASVTSETSKTLSGCIDWIWPSR